MGIARANQLGGPSGDRSSRDRRVRPFVWVPTGPGISFGSPGILGGVIMGCLRFRGGFGSLGVLGLAVVLLGGCGNSDQTVLQFPPGTKPMEPPKVDPSQAGRVQTGGGVMSGASPYNNAQ